MMRASFLKIRTAILTIVIIGSFLLSSTQVIAESETTLPYFAGDSSSVDSSEGDMVIFNTSRGFFPLPLSANGIPDSASPTEHPTLALADTLALSSDSEEEKGLVIYRQADGVLFVNTFVGDGNESAHSASYFGEGDFVMVMTDKPDECANLNLDECYVRSGFLSEKQFSITLDGTPATPVVVAEETVDEDSATTSISADLNDGETVTAPIDGVVVEETSPIAETETDSSQTAAVVEADSGIVDTVVETVLDIIGVGDTTEEVTPTPETPIDSATPETPADSSVTGDTNSNGTTTTTF